VALSFAGEGRSYVEKVAASLKEAGVRAFYDKFESADFATLILEKTSPQVSEEQP